MREPVLEAAADREFLRKVGVHPDWIPPLSGARKVLLAAALLLALSTTLLATVFQWNSVATGGELRMGVTQCPMSPPPQASP
jgi:hypothetical protein